MKKKQQQTDDDAGSKGKNMKKKQQQTDDDAGSKGKNMKNKQQQTNDDAASMDLNFNFKKIMQEVEFLGSSARTWKERKELENQKVVKLGGKTQKQQTLPLSVARLQMKNQKARENKMLQERLLYGQHGGKPSSVSRRVLEKRKPEDMVLKSIEGNFRNGVLDVKHMLKSGPSRDDPSNSHVARKGKKGGGKKNKGKKKGGGRKRR